MATKLSKLSFGNKLDIEAAKKQNKIDEYDIIFLDNGEIGWLNKEKNTIINTPRTQKAYTLNGTDFGALSSGQTIPSETSLDEIMAMTTQKSIKPEYVKPLVTLSNNKGTVSGIVEVGTSITPKLTATFTQNDAGKLADIVFKKGKEQVKQSPTSPSNYDGKPFIIGDETITYSAIATYKEGIIKNDNLGKPYSDGHIVAGTIASEDYNFTGKRCLFYGSGNGANYIPTSESIRDLNKHLNPEKGYRFTMHIHIGAQYIIIAYPDFMSDIERIHYIEGSDPNLAMRFKKSIVQVADARGGQEGKIAYKCYVLQLSTPIKANMTLEVIL